LRVDQCEQQRCPELRQLIKQRQDVANEYDKTVETLVKEIRDRTTNDKAFFDPTLVGKMEDIVSAQPKTVLIYHLILKDKIWVLWASKGGITKSIEVPNVGLEKVSSNVLKLRTLLQSPENLEELQKTSQQLREWLIPPQLQAELSANDIKHLVFAPDSVTRYIPMGVLYDGKKYLVENYTIATIISAGLTDTTSRLPNSAKNTSVLAAGLSQPVSGYSPLPNVLTEINAIVRTADNPSKGIYDGIKLLDSTFTKDSLLDNLGSHAIAHIATHGKFVSGDPDKSFLVLGNGKTLPIPEIKKLRGLSKLHLVVLSACQTALGGTNGDGTEISGISYFFLGIGAKSVIASLWEVSDDSTSLLMQEFYNNLSKSSDSAPVTKSEAMQQAQLSLLQKKITAKDNIQRGNIAVVYRGGAKPSDNYSHPYYWSPFILIGNGL
jgi:CHAT domain-containing protein